MAKREGSDQKRKRKRAKKAGKAAGAGDKSGVFYEASRSWSRQDGDFIAVQLGLPDGGRMPEKAYSGQEALDRARRWVFAYAEGRSGVPLERRPSRVDPVWCNAPAHGDPEGAIWSQRSTSQGARMDFRAKASAFSGLWLGRARGKSAVKRLDELSQILWNTLTVLPPDEIATRLLDGEERMPLLLAHQIIASGWCFQYSLGTMPDGDRALHQFSAQLRPVGRSSTQIDWRLLGAVQAALGIFPDPGDASAFLQWTDIASEDLDPNSRMTWRWFAEANA